MTVRTRPLAEVTRRAIEVLTRELGSADTLRFVNQFTTGLGDYTAEREHLFGEETLECPPIAPQFGGHSLSAESIMS